MLAPGSGRDCSYLWVRSEQFHYASLSEKNIWSLTDVMEGLTCLLRNLYGGQEATVRIGHGITEWFQIRKGVCQGCILSRCFNMQSTSCKMPGWMKHTLESSLSGEKSITSDMQVTPPLWQKVKTKEPLGERERREWKSWLKAQHSEN